MRKGLESAAAKIAKSADPFSRTQSAPSSLDTAMDISEEADEPGSGEAIEDGGGEGLMPSTSSSFSEQTASGPLGVASASAQIAGESFSRTRSAPSSADASCVLESAQHSSSGSLSGASRILSRRKSVPAEPAAGKVRLRLNKEGNLEHPSSKFHGGFTDTIFGISSGILASRFRWRTAASSAISHFHSIPSESFGLDKPEMREKLAELGSLAEEDDADNIQVCPRHPPTKRASNGFCRGGHHWKVSLDVRLCPLHKGSPLTCGSAVLALQILGYPVVNYVCKLLISRRTCATACASYLLEARWASSRGRRPGCRWGRGRACCARTWMRTGLHSRPSTL